jgi:cell division protease FtsH
MGRFGGGISPETANQIDAEVKKIVEGGHAEATRILSERADDLEKLAQGLLEYETLSGDEINDLIAGKDIHRPDPAAEKPATKKSSLPSTRRKATKDAPKDEGDDA